MSQNKKILLAAILVAYCFIEFFLMRFGFAGINLTLFFVVCIVAFFILFHSVKSVRSMSWFDWLLIVTVLGVGASYTLFDNTGLLILNFMSLLFFMGILFLNNVNRDKMSVDKKGFIAEYFLGCIARPFMSIQNIIDAFSARNKEKKSDDEDDKLESKNTKKKYYKYIFQIVLGLIIGIPVLMLLTSLLSVADAVFSSWTKNIMDAIRIDFDFSRIIYRVFLFIVLTPFMLSSFWSHAKKQFAWDAQMDPKTDRQSYFPALTGIVVLTLINVLYILFAVVQSVYLFSGWSGKLPEGVTYAEYARNGFFELAIVSVINLGLSLFFIIHTHRKSITGRILRVLCMILVGLSGVQIASALQRMRLYVQAYGLSEDRYLSTAFIFLIAVAFVILVIREFRSSFSFIKHLIAVAALALIIVNFSVPNARVAHYNIEKYRQGELQDLDYLYLARQSADSLLVLIDSDPDYLILIQREDYQRVMNYMRDIQRDPLVFNISKSRFLDLYY